MKPIIIVGSGLAGYSVAREFRRLDTHTPVTVLTRDDGRFYSKPMLSNALAQGKNADTLAMASAENMARQFQLRVLADTRVEAIDPRRGVVITERETLPYFKLVLALGADPLCLPLTGDGALDVLPVNDLRGYGVFRERLAGRRRVVILGAGLVGCEFADDLCTAGYRVEVVDLARWPLPRLLPEPAGRALRAALAARGIGWHFRNAVKRVERRGTAYELTLADGRRLDTDLILSATGLRPRTGLAKAAELATRRGITVDRHLQASAEAVYALGDCAEVEGLWLPYVTPITHAALALARTLAGRLTPVRYPSMPVLVKTPSHPVVVAPPPPGAAGEWHCETRDDGVRAVFLDPAGSLRGFALTGGAVAEKQALAARLPELLV